MLKTVDLKFIVQDLCQCLFNVSHYWLSL